MYDPAPVRPRKTDKVRTRTGCVQCRTKKRKCDEGKPSCGRCVRSMIACEYASNLQFRDATSWAAERARGGKRKARAEGTTPLSWTDASTVSSGSPPGNRRLGTGGDHDLFLGASLLTGSDDEIQHSLGQGAILSPGLNISAAEAQAWEETEPHSGDLWTLGSVSESCNNTVWPSPDATGLSLFHAFEPSLAGLLAASESGDTSQDDSSMLFQDSGMMESFVEPVRFRRASRSPKTSMSLETDDDARASSASMFLESSMSNSYDQRRERLLSSRGASWKLSPIANDYLGGSKRRHSPLGYYIKPATSSVLPTIPRALSTAREVDAGDRIYFAHFTLHMVGLLPPQLRNMRQVATSAEPIRLALMSLAAANMANLQGIQEHDIHGKSKWVPKDSHLRQASNLGSRALHLLSIDYHLSRPARLGVAVLLAYSQLELGTFSELFSSMQQLEVMILDMMDEPSFLGEELDILQGWSYLRAFCKRIYPIHGPYGIESRTEHLLDSLEERVASPPHLVDLIRVDALYLTYRVFLYKCMRGHSSTPKETLQNISTWWAIVKGITDKKAAHFCESDFDIILDEQDVYTTLQGLSRKLNNCPVPKEFPVNVHTYEEQYSGSLPLLDTACTSPFLFSSHERAMESIDYAFARVVCDKRVLERAMGPRNGAWAAGKQSTPAAPNPWLALILRIAAGLNPAECARRNTYRTGVIGQIMRSALLCGELAGLEFLDQFLLRILASAACYEDILTPVHISYMANKALMKEFSRGRHVVFGGMTYHPWTGKDVVFSEGEGEYFIICGREKDGRFFNDCVPLLKDA